ncbi:MAG: tetratricopeptide repeat protein, partial [Verrucomicrobiae bacterium]|nr:tetratricopeptide repeat protein [Verrucomicrobiae bacterium]
MKRTDLVWPVVLGISVAMLLSAPPLRADNNVQLASIGAAALATPEELSEQEIIRRKELLIRAQKSIAEADAAMKAGKYADAANLYQAALGIMPKSPATAKEMAAATNGYTAALIAQAKAAIKAKKWAEARKSADDVLKVNPD